MTVQLDGWGDDGLSSPVISLDDNRRAKHRAHDLRELDQLGLNIRDAAEELRAGDYDAVHDIVWAGSQALGLVLKYRLGELGWTRHSSPPPWPAG